MNRRSFFGAAASVAAAVPALAAVPPFPDGGLVGGKLQTLKLAVDGSAVAEQFELIKGYSRAFDMPPCRYPFRPYNARQESGYVYRTGFPSIDALRSISGVHKARMERLHVENEG